MPIDRPVYPDMVEIDLSIATRTSSGVINAGLDIDDDPTTYAAFTNPNGTDPAPPTYTVPVGSVVAVAFEVIDATPSQRFLRYDWGRDYFVTQIRMRLDGDGQAYTGVDFESYLGWIEFGEPPPEVPLMYIPLWQDDDIHVVDLDPPLLARGVVIYPDYLLDTAGLDASLYPELDLYQLQVYALSPEGEILMPLPTVTRTRVGVQAVTFYPWNDIAGPYDVTTACPVYGLSELDITTSSNSAVLKGGESVHDLGAWETARESTCSIKYAKCDLRSFNLAFGGTLVVDPADSYGGEVQYVAENLGDRTGFMRITARSTNGDGTDSIVICKAKVTGSFKYTLTKDAVTMYDMNLLLLWDYTYVRQDGAIGGIKEILFGAANDTAMHS